MITNSLQYVGLDFIPRSDTNCPEVRQELQGVDLPEGMEICNAFETTITMTLTMTIIITKTMMMKWIDMI